MTLLKAIFALIICAGLFQCTIFQNTYQTSMYEGRRLLGAGEYDKAQQDFLKAAEVQPDARAYAFAATASYKLHDLLAAMRYIEDAVRLDGKSYSYLRVLGYRALVLFAMGRQTEGLDALHLYLVAYRRVYPLMSIDEVERMQRTGQTDLPRLERLLDRQITTYENDLEEFWSTWNGWYGERQTPTPVSGGGGGMR